MPAPLAVSLELTATDLLSPELLKALATIREVQAATAELNGESAYGTPAVTGEFTANLAAMGAAGETAGKQVAAGSREATAALKEQGGAMAALHEEYVGGTMEMIAGFVAFEAVVQTLEKVTEAAREAEVAGRQLSARFGTSATEYRDFSEQVAQGTNFTAIQFERAASALAPLRRDYGLTDDELKNLLRTTADLAAANGVDLAQAANDVAATMRGQARAGVELGLNMRTNVIQGMQGLTEAEKAAALGGDSLAGAQSRLKIVNLEAAGAMGQAAAAAGATGDQFARLDGATARLYEDLAKSSGPEALMGWLATSAASADNLIKLLDILDAREKARQAATGQPGPADFFQRAGTNPFIAAAGYGGQQATEYIAAQLGITTAAAAALVKQQRDLEESRRGFEELNPSGFPSYAIQSGVRVPNAVYAQTAADEAAIKAGSSLAEAYRDETVRINEVTKALDPLTAAQISAAQSQIDYRDETVRAIEVQHLWGDELDRTRQRVSDLDATVKGFETNRSLIGSYASTLEADRALRRRAGLPELPGETAAIGQLLTAGYRQQLAEGPAALAAVQARLAQGADAWTLQRVQADHMDAQVQTANIVVQNGNGGAGGTMSGISGSGLPTGGLGSDRFQGARSSGPAYQAGLGRFGQ